MVCGFILVVDVWCVLCVCCFCSCFLECVWCLFGLVLECMCEVCWVGEL